MKRRCSTKYLLLSAITGTLLLLAPSAKAQGTISFNGAALFSGTQYSESGVLFQVVLPRGGTPDDMAGSPAIAGPSNVPYNPTPYMMWLRQNNPYGYVSFSLAGGSTFGLTSVQLADANSPSLSPVQISFVGYFAGGSTVTNTFTTPGNNADHLLNYQFTAGFASDLVSVNILAPRWAMDNLVYTVPEPSAVSLMLLGSGVFAYALRRNKERR